MNNETRNFYEVSAEYDNSILIIKDLINKIISVNNNVLKEKIDFLDTEHKYEDFLALLNAVIGKKTNKYYYCENVEDAKYYGLELGNLYETSKLNVELQSKYKIEKQLKLQARAILAEKLMPIINELKVLFSSNINKSDGSFVTIDSRTITEKDVEYFNNLIKYLELMLDNTGRLKILDAERDVFALQQAKEEYNKKSSLEKWFYKSFNKEQNVIENIAKKKK